MAEKTDFKIYIVFFLIIGAIAFVIAKDVSLPQSVTIPVALICLFTLIYLSFSKPHIALMILAAYAPFSRGIVGRFGAGIVGLNLTNMIILVVLVGWAFYCSMKSQRMFTVAPLNMPIMAFCIWGFLSLLFASLNYGDAYELDSFLVLFKRWLTPILLYFIALNIVKDKESFKKVMFIVMSVIFMIALMAIRDYMNAGGGSIESTRVGGIFDQPNTLGAFFAYNMFFFLAFFLTYSNSFKYWLLLIPFLVCFRGIMVTFSRGAYLACAFGGLMTTFFRSKFLFAIAMVLMIAVLVNPAFLPEGIQYRLKQTFSGHETISTDVADISDKSASSRLVIWQGAIQMIKDKPVLGYGYGVFPKVIGLYVPQAKEMDAHNTYLILAAEMGIPALLLFLLVLGMMIKYAWWLLKNTEDKFFKAFALGLLGGVFALLVANMFGSRLNSEEVSAYFWLLGGLLMRAVIMERNGEIA